VADGDLQSVHKELTEKFPAEKVAWARKNIAGRLNAKRNQLTWHGK